MQQPSANIVVEARAVAKQVPSSEGRLDLLCDINLTIAAGESVAVVGASGSGKSTLLGLLAGLDVPTSGQIFLDGVETTTLDEEQRTALRGRLLGFVFQSFQLLPALTALENVLLPLELAGRRDGRQRAEELLARVGLAKRRHHLPSQLSGGEQQRVAIARAFAAEPALLLADEPTGNLDAHTGEQIIELLFDLNTEPQTPLVLVTHDERLASRCQRRLHLDAGRLV